MGVKEQGIQHSKNRYRVVPRTLIFIAHGDKVLLLKGAPDKRIWPGKYNGIGGHVESGETVQQAALREIAEETGLTAIEDLTLRGVINIATEDPHLGIMLFIFTAVSPSEEISGSHEGTPEWVNWQEIDPSLMVADLPVLLPRMLSPSPTAPFFARYWYDEDDRLQIDFDNMTN